MHRGRGRLVAARQAIAAGDIPRAAELVAGAPALLDSRDRAELLRLRVQLAVMGASNARDVEGALAAEADAVSGAEPALAAMTLVDIAAMALYRNEPRAAMGLLDRARSLAVGHDDAARYVAAITGVAHTFLGDTVAAARALEDVLTPFRTAASVMDSVQAIQAVVVGLATIERYESATSVSQRAVAAARQTGAVGVLPLLLCLFANSAYFVGDYDAALFAAGEARDLAAADQPAMMLFASVCAALAHGVRGEADAVLSHVEAVRTLIPTAGMDSLIYTTYVAEGLVALGAGDDVHAAEIYDRIDRGLAGAGRRTGVLQWRADHIESLHRVGRHKEAVRALDEYTADIAGLPLPWSHAVAARCRGLLAADGWEAHFAAAVAGHTSDISEFELGRTQLAWAGRLRDAGRINEARHHARAAVTAFEAAAIPLWAARAHQLVEDQFVVDAPSQPHVEVCAFGPLTIRHGTVEQLVPLDAAGRLLRYLVCANGTAPVEQVVEALWPESPPGTGSTRLRNVLVRLRKRWGQIVVRDGSVLRWAPGVAVDLASFEAEAQEALSASPVTPEAVVMARRAVHRGRGELLPAARYAEWSVGRRERVRRTYVELLRLLADAAARGGDCDAAVGWLERTIDIERFDEGNYIRAAQILLDAGRPGAARRMLDRAVAALDELGVGPSAEVRQMQDFARDHVAGE